MKSLNLTQHSFLWYDYETFGLNPRQDKIAQFAAVRTDMNLNIIEEPIMLYCQPALDYLPSPESCLLTGITPQLCQQNGLIEAEFANEIFKQMAQPRTISVGYNSIRFDDEFTRFLFWRNLIDPYAREWQNSCGRWDLLDVVRLAYALRPEGINWPKNADNLPSFKLEHLTKQNNLLHEAAHDALSDVYATIAVAKLIKQRQPKLFEFALQLHKKSQVLKQLKDDNGNSKVVLHVSGKIPLEQSCLAVMYPLANHPTNSNEVICWNLAHDPSELVNLTVDQIKQRLFGSKQELEQNGLSRLAIKGIHLNKSPMVIANTKLLDDKVQQRCNLDINLLQQNFAKVQALPDLTAIWQQVYQSDNSTTQRADDVDSALYDGFLSNEDKRRLEKIKTINPQELAHLQLGFDDQRLAQLVFNYRARNYPQSLTQAEQQQWQQHCSARLVNGEAGVLTIEQFTNQLDEKQQQLDDQLANSSIDQVSYQRKQEILEQLYQWCSEFDFI